jgi:hypothetical protein
LAQAKSIAQRAAEFSTYFWPIQFWLDSTNFRLPPLGGEGWGGGIGARFQFGNRVFNHNNNCANALIDFLIPEAKHLEASRVQPLGATRIILNRFGFQVLWSI